MNTNKKEQIWESLQDPEYRTKFIEEHINVGIAFQLRSLRNRQHLTQAQLAQLMGNKCGQPTISEWENPNYGKYTLAKLKDLAKAFDVGLLVRFVPFSKLIDWTIGINSEDIAPPNFAEEQSLFTTDTHEAKQPLDSIIQPNITSDSLTIPYEVDSTLAGFESKGMELYA